MTNGKYTEIGYIQIHAHTHLHMNEMYAIALVFTCKYVFVYMSAKIRTTIWPCQKLYTSNDDGERVDITSTHY